MLIHVVGDDDPSFLANDVDEDYDDADYVEGHEPRVQDYTQPARGGPAKKAAKEDSNVAGGYKATLKSKFSSFIKGYMTTENARSKRIERGEAAREEYSRG